MKFKLGEKYTIQFWDHCLGDFKVLCEVTIYITKQSKVHLHGTWWRILTDDSEVEESNREMVTIIKSAIVKKRKLPAL